MHHPSCITRCIKPVDNNLIKKLFNFGSTLSSFTIKGSEFEVAILFHPATMVLVLTELEIEELLSKGIVIK